MVGYSACAGLKSSAHKTKYRSGTELGRRNGQYIERIPHRAQSWKSFVVLARGFNPGKWLTTHNSLLAENPDDLLGVIEIVHGKLDLKLDDGDLAKASVDAGAIPLVVGHGVEHCDRLSPECGALGPD